MKAVGQAPVSPMVLGSDKCRDTQEGSKSCCVAIQGLGPGLSNLSPWDKACDQRKMNCSGQQHPGAQGRKWGEGEGPQRS